MTATTLTGAAACFKARSAPHRRPRRDHRRCTSVSTVVRMAAEGDQQPAVTRRGALASGLMSSLGPLVLPSMVLPAAARASEFDPREKQFNGTWESVCSYNLLYFPTGSSPCASFEKTREDELAYILQSLGRPSLLFFQEINREEDLRVLEQVLERVNPSYRTAIQAENLNTELNLDVITVYDKSVFRYLPMANSAEVVNGGVGGRRDMVVKKFKHKGTKKEFLTANVHLKASKDYAWKREDEAQLLKARFEELGDTSSHIIAGDFNIYSSQEGGYKILAGGSGQPGIAIDPVDPDNKVFDGWFKNPKYAIYHTQSTRGGGCGSLDDRFDMMFVSRDFLEAGVGNYAATCNDGQHFDRDILGKSSCDMTGVLPQALYLMSDHLPVTMQLNFA